MESKQLQLRLGEKVEYIRGESSGWGNSWGIFWPKLSFSEGMKGQTEHALVMGPRLSGAVSGTSTADPSPQSPLTFMYYDLRHVDILP